MSNCAICGRSDPKVLEVELNDCLNQDEVVLYCVSCIASMYTCRTCEHRDTCSFTSDPLPVPQTMRKEIRQGPMVIVQEVPNPERIRQTCQAKCNCYNEEKGCMKQSGLCRNWKQRGGR